MYIAGEGNMHRVSWLILLQVCLIVAPLNVWGMDKHKERESVTHQDSSSKQKDKQRTSTTSVQSKQKSEASTIEAMFKSFLDIFKQRQEPPLVSRGSLCAISPGILGKTNEIWSYRPLFLWEGEVTKIIVRDYNSDEIIWEKSILADNQNAIYSGINLKPGNTYIWELSSNSSSTRNEFDILPLNSQQRSEIDLFWDNQQSQSLTLKLKKAIFLGKQGLWSDALQIIYSVDNSALFIKPKLKEIFSDLCLVKAISD